MSAEPGFFATCDYHSLTRIIFEGVAFTSPHYFADLVACRPCELTTFCKCARPQKGSLVIRERLLTHA